MLGIPFLKTIVKPKADKEIRPVKPDLSDLVAKAGEKLKDNQPTSALSMVAPWHSDDDAPSEIKLVAGRALAALGRFPEALEYFEAWVEGNPGSVEGLIEAGLIAARARKLTIAMEYFNRAIGTVSGRVRAILKPYLESDIHDPVVIEELILDLESNPGDRDRALALACALGRSGHFRAIERFLPSLY